MAEKQPYNAADPKHVKSRRGAEKRELLKNEDAFNFVMGDVRGRNFVWWLLSTTGLYSDGFTGNSSTFYNEGRRSVGLRLISDLEAFTPKEFITMWQEHLQSKALAELEDEATRTESVTNTKEEGEY